VATKSKNYESIIYKFLQKKFGRLTSDPIPNIKKQIEIANWLHQYNVPYKVIRNIFIEAKRMLKDNNIATYFKFLLTGRMKYHGYAYR